MLYLYLVWTSEIIKVRERRKQTAWVKVEAIKYWKEHFETRKFQTDNLTFHIKGLEKEQMKPKVSRRKEIKNGVEMNEIEMNKTIKKINETKSWLFEMINRIDKPLARLTKGKKKREGTNKISNERGMEKAMATHSSTLVWRIPWMEEPGRLQSMGSLRVGHDWATSLSLFTFMHWRRKWQPTPVFLPGESQGQGSLVGCRLWDCTELDTTEVT